MASFSGLAIGLSFLFGCVLLAFVAELYYLLWWKRKRDDIENQNNSSSSYTLTHLSCFKNPNSSRIPKTHPKDLQNPLSERENHEKQQDSTQKDLPLKGFGEESLDLELMRLHNLCGPPRFLFTISEETKEDLELESRKGSRTISLSELLCTPETPISSSPLKTQNPNLEGYVNPLFVFDSNEFDFNKIRSSPPPTFKFLRDAEEKLLRRLMELENEKGAGLKKCQDADCSMKTEEKDGNFVNLSGNKDKSEGGILYHHHQMAIHSKVLPLASSPSK